MPPSTIGLYSRTTEQVTLKNASSSWFLDLLAPGSQLFPVSLFSILRQLAFRN
ncbi:hypothetical protein GQ55_9G372700 [Panicum hallii var. hallii]|uniref:Uncharacterized protein n=1 Tax=Panicum hallii var. hallii TaxID=1504633 RepID=A0A2T7C907_9POAL|nr:hypothetical protein GQ55_9G372700 [Panicum hallii var. hallii]